MTTMPVHPPAGGAGAERTSRGLSRWQKAIGVLGLIVVFWVGDRLYTAIDSGGTSPAGGHQPGGQTPTSQPIDRPDPTGGGGGEHDPSQFDH